MDEQRLINFDGKVVLITGAAGGLGFSYAKEFAQRGASVMLADLTPAVADAAAGIDGITASAIGNVARRADCDVLVADVLNRWGRVDVLVNNAGILRDHSIEKQTDDEWAAVIDVHLTGTRNMTVAAWSALKASGEGRLINTTSASGLYGNFGQTNYAAAKLGIVGFTKACVLEGARHGIRAHCIAPVALTPMTDKIWSDDDIKARTRPELVSPVVTYLASSACAETGLIIAAGGGYIARVAIVEAQGARPQPGEQLDAEWVARSIAAASDMQDALEPSSVMVALDRAFGR